MNNSSANNGVFRKKKGFTIAQNSVIRDDRLSLKGKGLYTIIQSYITCDSFSLTKEYLMKLCASRDKTDSFNSAWNELKKAGYLKIHAFPAAHGHFRYEYVLLDEAETESGIYLYRYNAQGILSSTNKGKISAKSDNEKNERDHHPDFHPSGKQDSGKHCSANQGSNIKLYNNTDNNTKENKTDYNNKKKNNNNAGGTLFSSFHSNDIQDKQEENREKVRKYFESHLQLDLLFRNHPRQEERIQEIFDLLIDTYCSTRKSIWITKENKPIEIVKNRFMKLDYEHIAFILKCFDENTTQIRNIKQYLLAALYNAPITIDNYYHSLVKHDIVAGII